jgi:acyl-CoA synthetase (AMP-forming)/AMP-acid ligase II
MFIQYTSGSTGEPKGVVVSHSNITNHTSTILNNFEYGLNESSVTWLPTYHDMGLIGGILTPIAGLVSTVVMSPLTFIKQPEVWLDVMDRYHATCTGGPNFAYEYVSNRLQNNAKSYDFSAWKVAFCGAEPIRASTIRKFAEQFNIPMTTFYTCYGLAEACLMVTATVCFIFHFLTVQGSSRRTNNYSC